MPLLRIGFIPLVDCAPLVIAQEKGLFAAQGLRVELRKTQSWEQTVSRLAEGELEAAHMLVTVPLQWALGSAGRGNPLVYALSLGDHGNAITVSNSLWRDGARDPAGLAEWIRGRPERRPPRFAVVHPRSTHEYMLRLWLAEAGLEVGRDIALRYVPPHVMVNELRAGGIEGFCAGEPWNQRAAHSKLGYIAATSRDVLPPMNEKVLAVRGAWHRENARTHAALVRAVNAAAVWLGDPANLEEAVDLVASKRFINTAREPVMAALSGTLHAGGGRVLRPEGFLRLGGQGVNVPRPAHARFYLEQMVRFGHATGELVQRIRLQDICLESFYEEAAIVPAGDLTAIGKSIA